MDENFITVGELAQLVGVFVAPFLLAGAFAQSLVLRKAGVAWGVVSVFLFVSLVLMLVMTWALSWVIPPLPLDNHGAALMAPALIAATIMTIAAALYARVRRPAA
jgi:hypothetical protein